MTYILSSPSVEEDYIFKTVDITNNRFKVVTDLSTGTSIYEPTGQAEVYNGGSGHSGTMLTYTVASGDYCLVKDINNTSCTLRVEIKNGASYNHLTFQFRKNGADISGWLSNPLDNTWSEFTCATTVSEGDVFSIYETWNGSAGGATNYAKELAIKCTVNHVPFSPIS